MKAKSLCHMRYRQKINLVNDSKNREGIARLGVAKLAILLGTYYVLTTYVILLRLVVVVPKGI
jgi:hypothetical protein